VYNSADIDRQSVVFARDLGTAENEQLLAYYSDRTAWLLEPDARPPKLSPYQRLQGEPQQAYPAEPKPASAPAKRPKLKFEEVK
jgi:hypothetical protein